MQNDRDRLIELLDKIFTEQYDKRGILTAPHTADHLLANGVIVLPCKLGDTVYCLYRDCRENKTQIIPIEIETFEIHKKYAILEGAKGEHCYRYFVTEIGKTVFLTKEEAETKLKEKENGNSNKL